MLRFAENFGPAYALPACALLILPLVATAPLMTTWLAAIAALACLPNAFAARQHMPNIPRAVAISVGCGIAVILWGALSAVWSAVPAHSLAKAIHLAAFAIGGGILLIAATRADAASRARVAAAFAAGLAVACAIIVIELATSGFLGDLVVGTERLSPVSHLNRVASLLAIFVWLGAVMFVRWLPTFAVTVIPVCVLVLLLLLDPSSPAMALFVGAIVFGAALWRPRYGMHVLLALAVAAFLAAPFASSLADMLFSLFDRMDISESTILHRLDIWSFTGERVLDRPLHGWGLDASRAIPGGDALVNAAQDRAFNPFETKLPLHPHNATLQFWVELGLPGAVFVFIPIAAAIMALARRPGTRLAKAGALAAVSAALVIAELSYGIWQGWWLAALWILAALTVVATAGPQTENASSPGDD